MTLKSELVFRTTLLLDLTTLMLVLITLGKRTSLEAIEATQLLHGFCVDESSACFV